MTGENIARLRRATASSAAERLQLSSDAWLADADVLKDLAKTLDDTAREVERGFSDGVEGAEDGTAKRGSAAFRKVRKQVLERETQMRSASEVLKTAGIHLRNAENTRAGLPDAPGAPPVKPSSYGSADDIDEVRAARAFDTAKRSHDDAVANWASADADARRKLEKLDEAYAQASEVLARIHGEPVYPEDLPPPGETGPGGFPTGPPRQVGTGPRPGVVGVGDPDWYPGGHGDSDNGTVDMPPHLPDHDGVAHPPGLGPVGGTIGNPVHGTPPGAGGGGAGGGGFNLGPSLAGGAVGAGILGGAGVVNAIRNAMGGRNPFASNGQQIGASRRVGGAGTLGRPGGASGVGSPVQRGGAGGRGSAAGGRAAAGGTGGTGSRGGAAGKGGASGVGSAGGRGRAGSAAGGGGRGRGAAPGAGMAAAGGRGGRSREEERGRDGTGFDDGTDWIDDEGAAPGVLD